jgi:hypothetical protein
MFEGRPPNTGASQPLDLETGEQGELRPVCWRDLVARLDAAREFRVSRGVGEAAGDASFDPHSARHIAEIENGKPDINLDDLANGKAAGRISQPNKNGAEFGVPR